MMKKNSVMQGEIPFFLRLHLRLLRNKYGMSKEILLKKLSGIILGACLFAYAISFVERVILQSIPLLQTQIQGVSVIFIWMILLWLSLISFLQSMQGYVRYFLYAQDMPFYMILPISISKTFLYKFFDYVISGQRTIILFSMLILSSLGVWMQADWRYFLNLPGIILCLVVVFSASGLLVAMVATKYLSVQVFQKVVSLLLVVINVSMYLIMVRNQVWVESWIIKAIELLRTTTMFDLVPMVSAVKVLVSASLAGWSLDSWGYLLFITVGSMLLFIFAAVKLFPAGWNRVVQALSKTYKLKVKTQSDTLNLIGIFPWVKKEWLIASRNKEMFGSSFFMLLIFLFPVGILSYAGIFFDQAALGVWVLIMMASLTNVMAISLLFIPIDVSTDKSLWKQRYWIQKTLPLSAKSVFYTQLWIYYIPAVLISVLGVLLYAYVAAFTGLNLLFSLLYLLIVLFSGTSVFVSVELWSLSKMFEHRTWMGEMLTFLLPLAYGLLSAGSWVLFLARDYLSSLSFAQTWTCLLQLPVIAVVSISTIMIGYLCSHQLFIHVWEQLEI